MKVGVWSSDWENGGIAYACLSPVDFIPIGIRVSISDDVTLVCNDGKTFNRDNSNRDNSLDSIIATTDPLRVTLDLNHFQYWVNGTAVCEILLRSVDLLP